MADDCFRRRTRQTARRLAILVPMLLLPDACTSILPGADRMPPQLFELTAPRTFAGDLPRIDAQLLVETPTASASLRSSRIAIRRGGNRLDYIANSEWTDLATNLVQTLLIEAFDNADRTGGVARQGSGLRTDYLLKSELRAFHVETRPGAPARIRLRLHVRLVRWDDRDIVAARTFAAGEPLADNSVDAIVGGFDTALAGVLRQVVGWSLRQIRDRPPRRPQ